MDKTVRLWHAARKECLCCFQHIDFVTAIAFHPKVGHIKGWNRKKTYARGGPQEIFTVIVFRIEIVFQCVVLRIQLLVSSIPLVLE